MAIELSKSIPWTNLHEGLKDIPLSKTARLIVGFSSDGIGIENTDGLVILSKQESRNLYDELDKFIGK